MSVKRCLYCYKPLGEEEVGFHHACSRRMFGKPMPPELPYNENQMLELAEQVVKSHATVTGVQPKLSLGIRKINIGSATERFTIVGALGDYILKPPTRLYPHLPELEDLTMHLASIAGIATVPHSLISLQSGHLSYITRRIDRAKKEKFHMEDMCQLTERMTEAKYRGSYEQIGKAITQYSANPGLDIINFFEQVVCCFLTGNNDMHMKNFSLLKKPGAGYTLSPAYDMVASALVVEGDSEEMALTLNAKKRKLKRKDFEAAMHLFGLEQRVYDNIFERFEKALPQWYDFIKISFLPPKLKKAYIPLIQERAKKLEII